MSFLSVILDNQEEETNVFVRYAFLERNLPGPI